ncbi:MAG: hypothetical protein Q4E55_05395 [Bacteroidales bacterium]|nr:hypothetical protein [Bacteroidales bacterium]
MKRQVVNVILLLVGVLCAYSQGVSLDAQQKYYQRVLQYRRPVSDETWLRLECKSRLISQQDGHLLAVCDTVVWIPERMMLDEFRAVVAQLPQGVFSSEFSSPMGTHVVRWTDKRCDGQPADVSLDAVCTLLQPVVGEPNVEVAEVVVDESVPRFQGAVIHCRSKVARKYIKKRLKKQPQEHWKSIVESIDLDIRMECGTFPIGQNQYVDKLVFKCGGFDPLDGYPVTFVLGRKLKKKHNNR